MGLGSRSTEQHRECRDGVVHIGLVGVEKVVKGLPQVDVLRADDVPDGPAEAVV
jgi:hypothetical protein